MCTPRNSLRKVQTFDVIEVTTCLLSQLVIGFLASKNLLIYKVVSQKLVFGNLPFIYLLYKSLSHSILRKFTAITLDPRLMMRAPYCWLKLFCWKKIMIRHWKVDRVTANHSLSSTASQGTSNIPFPCFLVLGCNRQAQGY